MRAGLETFSTVDVIEGLASAASPDIDVVLSDIQMPTLSGLGLLQSLRRQGSDVEVVLMTGSSSLASAVDAVKAGA